jgi:RNA polymerase sigma-70 factor (ECF subfamily)
MFDKENDLELINRCLKNEAKAQEELYRKYARKMYGVCLRFAKNKPDADDIMQESFIKVFVNLKHFMFAGSFEGWIRRIITTTAINFYKKNLKHMQELDINEMEEKLRTEEIGDQEVEKEDLISFVQELPDLNRIIFNMFVIDGFSHKEIGNMLNIPENTSKSHLHRAKLELQKKIVKSQKVKTYSLWQIMKTN